jgi:hypothetical protein
MTRWSDLTNAELDQRLAAELQSMAQEPRLAPDWGRLELLPSVRTRVTEPRYQVVSRGSWAYALAGAIGGVALLCVLLLVVFGRPPSIGGPPGTPPTSTVRSGEFTLTMTADKAVYAPGDPINANAVLSYDGSEQEVQLSGSGMILAFGLDQLDGQLAIEPVRTADCARHEIRPATPITSRYAKSGGWSQDDPAADFWEEWFRDPELRLPAGRWRLESAAQFVIGADCSGQQVDLRTAVEITVAEPRATDAPARTPPSTYASFNARDFAARLRAGQFRGQTLLVSGEIAQDLAFAGGPCEVDEACPFGRLAGVNPPLTVFARHVPTTDGRDAIEAQVPGSEWRWWHQPSIPSGTQRFLLHVLDDGTVEYVGYEDEEHSSWGLVSLVDAIHPAQARLHEVIVVPGWLTGIASMPSCAPPEPGTYLADLPGRYCGPDTWLSHRPARLDPAGYVVPSGALQLQSGAFAELVGYRATGEIAEPVPGLWAVARRLEGSGCPDSNPPCWRWNLVAKVSYQEMGPAMPVATPDPTDSPAPEPTDQPTPTPDPGAPVVDSQRRQTLAGTFELTLRAGRAEYAAGEPIDIEGALTYLGPAARVTVAGGPLAMGSFTYRQLDGELEMSKVVTRLPCVGFDLVAGQPMRTAAAALPSLVVDDAEPNADFYRRWRDSTELWLPAGQWLITFGAGFAIGPDGCGDDGVGVSSSIIIVVR